MVVQYSLAGKMAGLFFYCFSTFICSRLFFQGSLIKSLQRNNNSREGKSSDCRDCGTGPSFVGMSLCRHVAVYLSLSTGYKQDNFTEHRRYSWPLLPASSVVAVAAVVAVAVSAVPVRTARRECRHRSFPRSSIKLEGTEKLPNRNGTFLSPIRPSLSVPPDFFYLYFSFPFVNLSFCRMSPFFSFVPLLFLFFFLFQ